MSEPIDAEIVPDDKKELAKSLDEPLPVVGPIDYSDDGVPTFDYVRDRIENRVATSAGMEELTGGSPQAKSIDEQMAERDKAGLDKLEEIRRSMRGE
jgi:phage shock protein A